MDRLPDWPRRMRAETAAAYFDVSEATFLRRVKEGQYPPGKRDGTMVLWDREVLDHWADKWAGLAKTKHPELKSW